jgi:acyl-coenzyme A thioesterase PaaI-like protein
MIAALLDGAMTHCLFAQGLAAVTAELTVRYRYPVAVRRMATIHAWLERAARHLQVVRAELRQDGVIKASARAKFMKNEP